MPKNSTILIIRHGEKPANGADLTPAGLARAAAYIRFFENYPPGGTTPLTVDYVFSAANSSASCRPQLTIAPFAATHGLPINDTYADTDFAQLAKYITGGGYDNSTLLICWHHEEALDLAGSLGVDPTKLPSSANWPASWPGGPAPTPDVYGWVLQIVYDSNGAVDTTQTFCTSEQLMYDDYGQEPPDGTSSGS